MDEEKTIDEAVEQADEMKEFEPVAFDEVIKESEPVKDSAPVLRDGGDPEPADMNMIHKHVDNFLAKIAGETPIDENVRDSTEYWLDRIYDTVASRPIKVWENNSPTSSFSAQSVDMDLTPYKTVIVVFKTSTTGSSFIYSMCGVGENSIVTYATTARLTQRPYDVAEDKITFSAASSTDWASITSGLSNQNTYAIPVYVYGII